MRSDLVHHVAALAVELRGAGVRVATGDEIDALAVLGRIDIGDPAEVRLALRCALKIRPRDLAAFEDAFRRLWLQQGSRPQPPTASHGPGQPTTGRWPWPAAADEAPRTEGDEPGWTPQALLRQKSFEDCDERDLARMEPLLSKLAMRLATRRSRRLRPTPTRGQADLRRSLRRAISTGGELLSLARRGRPVEVPKLVFLCDTSGSMEMHTQFILAFARALMRVAPTTEVFAFNTALTRITTSLQTANLAFILARLRESVPDWAGGTRIGACLKSFVDEHLQERVDARTTVIVFSDGLDRGEPEVLAGALRRIRARARTLVWLNPLLSDPRYEPTARGMAAALPFVDRLAPAHDLVTLERLVAELTV